MFSDGARAPASAAGDSSELTGIRLETLSRDPAYEGDLTAVVWAIPTGFETVLCKD